MSTIHVVDEGFFKERNLRGMNVNLFDAPKPSHEGLRRVVEMVEQGRLRVPIVAERNLVDAVQALELVKAGKVSGKVILTV